MLLYGLISVFIIVLDQITKIIVSSNFTDTTKITLIPHLFDLVYAQNTGAAFSILSDHVSILGIVSVVFCMFLILYVIIKKPSHPLLLTSLSLIFAGAVGNGIDRIARGYVIDFIETTFMNFPVFNIADIAITTGAALLMVFVIFFDKSEK